MDTSNFDKEFTGVHPVDSPVNSLDKITNSQENLFAGFSYVRSCSPAFSITSPAVSDENIGGGGGLNLSGSVPNTEGLSGVGGDGGETHSGPDSSVTTVD